MFYGTIRAAIQLKPELTKDAEASKLNFLFVNPQISHLLSGNFGVKYISEHGHLCWLLP